MQITLDKETEKDLRQLLELVNLKEGQKHDLTSLLSLIISTELLNAVRLSENNHKLN